MPEASNSHSNQCRGDARVHDMQPEAQRRQSGAEPRKAGDEPATQGP